MMLLLTFYSVVICSNRLVLFIKKVSKIYFKRRITGTLKIIEKQSKVPNDNPNQRIIIYQSMREGQRLVGIEKA